MGSVKNLDGTERKDGRYPQRIGRRCKFVFDPNVDGVMFLNYCPREGETYKGILRTSRVEYIQHSLFGGGEIATQNSIYYFEVEELD